MVYIPGGTFVMGSPEYEEGRRILSEEKRYRYHPEKQEEKTVPSFYMSKYPVTQAQWNAVWEAVKSNKNDTYSYSFQNDSPNPSYYKGDNLPVHGVNWHDAIWFCYELSRFTSKNYRLPSSTLWEYACRAYGTTPFHYGKTLTSKLANFNKSEDIDQVFITPVGTFPPNAFGLYDMHGNVWEWCSNNWYVLDTINLSEDLYLLKRINDKDFINQLSMSRQYTDSLFEYSEGLSFSSISGVRTVKLNRKAKPLRGGSYMTKLADCRCANQTDRESSFHNKVGTLIKGHEDCGFRVVSSIPLLSLIKKEDIIKAIKT